MFLCFFNVYWNLFENSHSFYIESLIEVDATVPCFLLYRCGPSEPELCCRALLFLVIVYFVNCFVVQLRRGTAMFGLFKQPHLAILWSSPASTHCRMFIKVIDELWAKHILYLNFYVIIAIISVNKYTCFLIKILVLKNHCTLNVECCLRNVHQSLATRWVLLLEKMQWV